MFVFRSAFFLLIFICGRGSRVTLNPGGPYKTSGEPREGVLNVHLVPHTHDDVGWLKTVEELYMGSPYETRIGAVKDILDSVVDSLLANVDRRFVYVEMAFFSRWWRKLPPLRRSQVKELLKSGRLEFINGGWASNDEATPSFVDIVDQHTMGAEFITREFGSNFNPTIGWQVDPFGHSKFQAEAFAKMGFNAWYFGRSDSQDFAIRSATHRLETIHSGILTGSMDGYGAPQGYDWDVFSTDMPLNDDEKSGFTNIEERLENFVKECQRRAKIYNFDSEKTQHIMLTMGSDFEYSKANTWFSNLDKLIHYAKQDGRINVFYSTPREYTESRHNQRLKYKWESRSDYDWFPYCDSDKTGADESGKLVSVEGHAYWTGYFSSRPFLKRKVREASAMLEHCRIAELRHISPGQVVEKEKNPAWSLWEALAVTQHHDGVSGTSRQRVAWDYFQRLDNAMHACKSWISELGNGENPNNTKKNLILPSSLADSTPAAPISGIVPVTVKFAYYTSSVGLTKERPGQASGAYIFRPECQEGAVAPCRPTIIGDEARDWVKYSVFADRVEWEIGPIPAGSDWKGKEVVILIEAKNSIIDNKDVFYTDSNAFEWIQRRTNKRKTWNYVVTDPVAGNYYPVVSSIAIVGSGKALIVTADRSAGGTSLERNQIELMVHRYTTRDDNRGIVEPLMDVDEQGKPLVVKGTTYFKILNVEDNDAAPPISVPLDQIRPSLNLGRIPVMVAGKLRSLDLKDQIGGGTPVKITHFHRVNMPDFCKLESRRDCILVRIAYLKDPVKKEDLRIDLFAAFSKSSFGHVLKITETVLHGGVSLDESEKRRIYWSQNSHETPTGEQSSVKEHASPGIIIIKAGEIRTFVVSVGLDYVSQTQVFTS